MIEQLRTFSFYFLYVLLALSILFSICPLVCAQQSEAELAVASAKQRFFDCYPAVREAEVAGANVSSLTVELNRAGEMLSRAELAFSDGDYDDAIIFASRSSQDLENLIDVASTLRFQAIERGNIDLLVYGVGTMVGLLAVISSGIALWFWLKKRFQTSGVVAA